MFAEKIFNGNDVRGRVDIDFDVDFAYQLGKAFAFVAKEIFYNNPHVTLVVGADCRLSSPKLKEKLIEGIIAEGVDVLDIGTCPTPQLYYIVNTHNVQGGVQVTGSHNPADENGFKLLMGKSLLSSEALFDLRERVKAVASAPEAAPYRNGLRVITTPGKVAQLDVERVYLKHLVDILKNKIGKGRTGKARKIKVVCDAGNGMGSIVGPKLLRELGCEVIELFCKPDGKFPNHHPDPTVAENIMQLRKTVVANKADLGIGWDGDADRIGVVDEKGDVIYSDMLAIIIGRQLIDEVRNPIIIADSKCSNLLFSDLSTRGAIPVMCKTGHGHIKRKMKELNAHFAVEMSGHMFFAHEYFGFDDAFYVSAKIIEILSNTKSKMSELLSDLPKCVSTPEIRLDCPEEIKYQVAEQAQKGFPEYAANTMDGIRISFPHGWSLVRASNTQPILVLRFEADTEEHLEEYQDIVMGRIKNIVNGF